MIVDCATSLPGKTPQVTVFRPSRSRFVWNESGSHLPAKYVTGDGFASICLGQAY